MSFLMKNRILWIVLILAAAALSYGGFIAYRGLVSKGFDTRLTQALEGVQNPHTYVMQDDTHAAVAGRYIDISGLYRLDFDNRRFGADSTTTLTILEDKPPRNTHSFTLAHRSIGDDIYVKIDTQSKLLQKTIPYGTTWRHFKANAIPERFVDIAVPGAILDNVALLGNNGAYLSPLGEPVDKALASSTYHVYSFTLSKKALEVQGGPLRALIDLIATGTVALWLDDTPSVRMIQISGPSYAATSTILGVNTTIEVTAPEAAE
jgi:hypothetical protein